MSPASRIKLQLQLIFTVCLLFLTTAGCSVCHHHREPRCDDPRCVEMLGVDDTQCHGYKKTCWRTWDEVAWAATGCPQTFEVTLPQVPVK